MVGGGSAGKDARWPDVARWRTCSGQRNRAEHFNLDLRSERGFCCDGALALTAITTQTPFLAVYPVQIKSGMQ